MVIAEPSLASQFAFVDYPYNNEYNLFINYACLLMIPISFPKSINIKADYLNSAIL